MVLVERSGGKQIMYPVDKRVLGTLLKIISKQVDTDGWVDYAALNEQGYQCPNMSKYACISIRSIKTSFGL